MPYGKGTYGSKRGRPPKKKVMKKMGTKKEKEEMKVDNIYQATEPYMKFIDEYHRETIKKKSKKK